MMRRKQITFLHINKSVLQAACHKRFHAIDNIRNLFLNGEIGFAAKKKFESNVERRSLKALVIDYYRF